MAIGSNSKYFDLFWEQSNYDQFNISEFASIQEQFSAKEKPQSIFEYPQLPQKLILPKTSTNRLAKKRNSVRTFSEKPLSKRSLGIILSSFYAFNGLEHRSYPSAGGSYSVEVFCVANNVTGFSGNILYYNPDVHAVSIISNAPSWKEQTVNINVQTGGVPQCVLVFVLVPSRLTAKYLERGGRFALIEVGAAIQQLSSQIAGTKMLKGVAVGGMIDDYWLRVLEIKKNDAKIALGYLCGR